MSKGNHTELHQVKISFYPAGSEVEFHVLDDSNILTRNWENNIEDYPETLADDPLLKLTDEIVTCDITFLGEGLNGYNGTLEYEVLNVGFDDVFDPDDLQNAVEVARGLAKEWTTKREMWDEENLTLSHSVQFLAIFDVIIDTGYDEYGHADMQGIYATFDRQVPMKSLLVVNA